jgi:hypothetical protein
VNTDNAVTYWGVNNGLLKNLVAKGDNRINGTVRATQTVRTIDGNLRSNFVASRRVTVDDPAIIAQIKPLLADNTEFAVNVFGYFTSTPKESKAPNGDKITTWYDNYVITKLEVLQ